MIMILVAYLGAYSFFSIKCPLRARVSKGGVSGNTKVIWKRIVVESIEFQS